MFLAVWRSQRLELFSAAPVQTVPVFDRCLFLTLELAIQFGFLCLSLAAWLCTTPACFRLLLCQLGLRMKQSEFFISDCDLLVVSELCPDKSTDVFAQNVRTKASFEKKYRNYKSRNVKNLVTQQSICTLQLPTSDILQTLICRNWSCLHSCQSPSTQPINSPSPSVLCLPLLVPSVHIHY